MNRTHFLTLPSEKYNDDRLFLKKCFSSAGILYEGKPEPFEILPYLVPGVSDELTRAKFVRFHALLEKTIDLFAAHQDVRDYFNFNKSIEELITLPCPYSPRIHLCRFDYTYGPDGNPVIYETNSDCPGGLLKMRRIFEGYKETSVFKDLCRLPGIDISAFEYFKAPVFTHSLGRLYSAVTGKPDGKPVIAILNSRHKTLTNEIGLMTDELKSSGFEAFNLFVEDLEYRGGKLLGRGKFIDLCYQKFDYDTSCEYPFTPKTDSAREYIKALRDRRVIGVNSFASCYLIESKTVLALFWDKDFEKYFTAEELALSRSITARTELLRRQNDETIKRYKAGKDSLVLKQSLDTRGRSVLIGRHTSQELWDKTLDDNRCDNKLSYVVQTHQEHEQYSDQENQRRYISHAYFIIAGEPTGMFTRLSISPVTNVGKCGMTGISFKMQEQPVPA